MTSGTHRTRYLSLARAFALAGAALLLVGLGLAATVHAQSGDQPPTRYVSIFDSAATSAPAAVEPAAATEVTEAVTIESAATVVPQVTRYTSIFDAPAPAGQASPIVPADSAASATPVPQVTRYTSVFDSPGSSAASTAVPPASAPAPTRVPSIFDTQNSGAPANSGAAGGAVAQPTPYVSIFDNAASSVISYQGEGQPSAEYCLGCHANPYLQMGLPSGEVISVSVDEEAYKDSVHGQHGTDGYRCIRCHVGMNEYPHSEVTAQTSRELVIELATSCARCHTDKYDETKDDLHIALMARGVENAATCSDCHTGHAVQRITDEITHEPLPGSAAVSAQMCSGCHADIYAAYSQSVHGQSVLTGSNDAAACADCHGVHSTKGPTTDSSFLLFSPQICARCHADETLMAKYDISTDVFQTYVADFHGTTVSLFQANSPDQSFNTPVCADCHGVHNIMTVTDADSPVIKANLINTCRRCHPDATTNFSSAWLSHYSPSFERTPVIAVANLAYTIAIPAIIGGLGVFVVADVRRRRSKRDKER